MKFMMFGWIAIGALNFISVCINGFHVMHGTVELLALMFVFINSFFVFFSIVKVKRLYLLIKKQSLTQEKTNVALQPYAKNQKLQKH